MHQFNDLTVAIPRTLVVNGDRELRADGMSPASVPVISLVLNDLVTILRRSRGASNSNKSHADSRSSDGGDNCDNPRNAAHRYSTLPPLEVTLNQANLQLYRGPASDDAADVHHLSSLIPLPVAARAGLTI